MTLRTTKAFPLLRKPAATEKRPEGVVGLSDPIDEPRARPANRRTHMRLRASDLRWLSGAKLRYGSTVHIVDVSAGGILIETDRELRKDATIVFELAGQAGPTLVPARVLRSRVTDVFNGVPTYQTACTFKRPLELPDVTAVRSTQDVKARMIDTRRPPADAPPAQTAVVGWQKVVARYQDGRLLRGYTNNFHPTRDKLHVALDPRSGTSQAVVVSELKALFFVRDFDGDPTYVEQKEFAGPSEGRKVEVTFSDREVLVGSTLNYRGDGTGFIMKPADDRSNNLRVFVVTNAIKQVRFL